ncbi:MAG: MerR family transcriptional regulator [Sporomusaceae bacterium]|nr:MerR family transcriptional regulator [Sporomusaceae bacterium]
MKEKWTIGEVANLFEVSTDTLRHYEKMGLFSSQKNEANGYRYYSYDEIIVLMDILFFRNLELPVKEVKRILTELDISDITSILYQSQTRVEKRIRELTHLKQQIEQAACQYQLCKKLIGKFQYVSAPEFKYKLVSNQSEDLVAMIRKYKKEDWLSERIQYTLMVLRETLVTNPSFIAAQIGLSAEEEHAGLLNQSERQVLSSFAGKEYLYTVIGTTYIEPKNSMLDRALQYINATGRNIVGPLIGRYIASEHKNSLDYYEIWIETQKT